MTGQEHFELLKTKHFPETRLATKKYQISTTFLVHFQQKSMIKTLNGSPKSKQKIRNIWLCYCRSMERLQVTLVLHETKIRKIKLVNSREKKLLTDKKTDCDTRTILLEHYTSKLQSLKSITVIPITRIYWPKKIFLIFPDCVDHVMVCSSWRYYWHKKLFPPPISYPSDLNYIIELNICGVSSKLLSQHQISSNRFILLIQTKI